jgi:poly-gamma-glutamate synthesis protein (capsule biosynthesis protein)
MAALTLAGFDEMTVATNHVFDCGLAPCGNRAFLQTLDRLAAAGIKTVGGGRNLDEALAPAIFEINGVKFGVLGFDDIAAEDLEATEAEAGTAPLDDSYADEKAALPAEPAFYKPPEMLGVTRLQDTIRALKQEVDVVIVQIQSGFEDTHDASPRSIKGLRAAADAGADLVVGNQGHNVQSLEVRGNSFIAYALGNFIFDQQHTVAETQGYVLEASFWGKQLVNVRLRPYEIVDRYRPTFVTGDTRAQILSDIFAAAADLP